MTYRLIKDKMTGTECGAVRYNTNGTNTSFLFDPANTDYQEYLKWLSEGNEPLPAETE